MLTVEVELHGAVAIPLPEIPHRDNILSRRVRVCLYVLQLPKQHDKVGSTPYALGLLD